MKEEGGRRREEGRGGEKRGEERREDEERGDKHRFTSIIAELHHMI